MSLSQQPNNPIMTTPPPCPPHHHYPLPTKIPPEPKIQIKKRKKKKKNQQIPTKPIKKNQITQSPPPCLSMPTMPPLPTIHQNPTRTKTHIKIFFFKKNPDQPRSKPR